MRKDCDTCKHDEFCWKDEYCEDCLAGNPPTRWEPADYYKPDTNIECIRNMTNEQLARFLCEFADCHACPAMGECNGGHDAFLKWFEKPYGF